MFAVSLGARVGGGPDCAGSLGRPYEFGCDLDSPKVSLVGVDADDDLEAFAAAEAVARPRACVCTPSDAGLSTR